MPKKAKSYAFHGSRLILFQYQTKTGFARWSYRIALPDRSQIERVLCDHFAYSNHHYRETGEKFPVGHPPSDKIVEYATRVFNAYKEEFGRTGKLSIRQPSLVDLIDKDWVSPEDAAFLDAHIPDREGSRAARRGEVLFLELDRVTKAKLDDWLGLFEADADKARIILRKILAHAYEAGLLDSVPAVL